MMNLADILNTVRQHQGIALKADIPLIAELLSASGQVPAYPNGDDTAVIESGTGYDLFAIEGFINAFVARDPWFAGWCGLMVNFSDIAAMGGTPVAVVNALWGGQDETARQVLQGMADASRTYQVPVVGGHTNLHTDQPQLAVAVLGKTRHLLSSFAARPGQVVIAAIDLRGDYRGPSKNWNAATSAPPERLREDLRLLPAIAKRKLATAAKDISQAGLLGTLVMLLESAGCGAHIQLQSIPRPASVDWEKWLCSFPSFGFLLTTTEDRAEALLDSFRQRDIAASVIGHTHASRQLTVSESDRSDPGLEFWNLESQPLTGMNGPDPSTPDKTSPTNQKTSPTTPRIPDYACHEIRSEMARRRNR